ncbi:MAG: ribose 5-phosphate isomerase B [Acholeplasmataceae bacterium]|jgi:ribose 5-phosphate isomerase B
MKVVIANDHGGYELKRHLLDYFKSKGIEIVNLGTNSNDSVDYPIYGEKLAKEVLKGEYDFGIAICGTGIGISISVNKFRGIRAALIYDERTAMLAKEHNNANVIVLGGRTLTNKRAEELIEAFMSSKFESRHQHRLDLLEKMGEKVNE